MSDEIKDEVKTDHVPQLRTTGRKRSRPVGDPNAVVAALKEQNANLQKQVENVMSMLLAKAADTPNRMLPPKPKLIERPQGFMYLLERKIAEEVPRQTQWPRTVPSRPDNPNEPDPRYCVFCAAQTLELTMKTKANLAKEYDLDLSATPTTEEEIRANNRAHKEHLREVQGYESSKDSRLRKMYADHFDLKAIRFGRVPDCVKFRTTGRRNDKEKEVSLTAEQANELNYKRWEADCAIAVANQGR